MSINVPFKRAGDLPSTIAIFPLEGVLLLPRGQLPLNIFEPRYLAMIDDAMKNHRIIGMVQPNPDKVSKSACPETFNVGCAGKITQLAETGDGRYILTLSGVARFRIVEELAVMTPYRQCLVDFDAYPMDFEPRAGEDEVDRAGVIRTLDEFARVNRLKIDWSSIESAPSEALVNALAMMSPFGPKEKQAMLEAADLRQRAEVLIAITEIELARGDGAPSSLQ